MAYIRIADLPTFTGDSSGSFLLINDASNTATFKVQKETYFSSSLYGTASWSEYSVSSSYVLNGLTSASNGLTVTGSTVELGGFLYKDTYISSSDYSISFKKTVLNYSTDVSAFYTSRSFVDKEYVDNRITRIATGSVTASVSPSGFNVNSNTTISGSLSVSGSSNLTGYLVLSLVSSSLDFANDSAAAAGGVSLGGIYRSGSLIRIRIQ